MTRRRIIIVDDHPLFRAALRQTLSGGDATVSVEEAGDLNGLSAALRLARSPASSTLTVASPPARVCRKAARNRGWSSTMMMRRRVMNKTCH